MFTGLKKRRGEKKGRNKGNFLNEKVREIPIMGAIAKITDWNSGGIRGFNFYENFQIDNVPVITVKIPKHRLINNERSRSTTT